MKRLTESIDRIRADVEANYCGHHQYDWIRPRKTWLDATRPVYIDFGNDWLCKLEVYDETGLQCIRLVAKQKFVYDAMTEKIATDIAIRFYPLPGN